MDDKSKSARQAEDYIRYTTRKDVKQKDIKVDEQGRICVDTHKSIKVDHVALADMFIKYAEQTPGVSALSRKIIMTRIINPGISTTGIALSIGLRNSEVLKYERDGINRIKDFIVRISFQEGVEKANRDRTVDEAVKNLNLQGDNNSLLK